MRAPASRFVEPLLVRQSETPGPLEISLALAAETMRPELEDPVTRHYATALHRRRHRARDRTVPPVSHTPTDSAESYFGPCRFF